MTDDSFRRRNSPAAGPREAQPLEFKLFVGGIPHKYTDRDLKDAFRRHDASRATVMIDRKTGRSRGFGFVYFTDRRACDDAIGRMHMAVLEGRKVSVTRAVPETQTVPGTPATMLASGRGMRSAPRGERGRESRRDSDRWSSRTPSRRTQDSGRYDRGNSTRHEVRGGWARERDRDRAGSDFRRSSDRSESNERDDLAGDGLDADSQERELPRNGGGRRRRAGAPPPYADAVHHICSVQEYDESGFDQYRACPLEDISDYIAQLQPSAPLYSFPEAGGSARRKGGGAHVAPRPQERLGYSVNADSSRSAPSGHTPEPEREREQRPGVVGGLRGSSTMTPRIDAIMHAGLSVSPLPADQRGGEMAHLHTWHSPEHVFAHEHTRHMPR